jgi:hypothetical protein
MLTIFHHPKAKKFSLAIFARNKKLLASSQPSFYFFSRKLAKQKVFALGL